MEMSEKDLNAYLSGKLPQNGSLMTWGGDKRVPWQGDLKQVTVSPWLSWRPFQLGVALTSRGIIVQTRVGWYVIPAACFTSPHPQLG